MAKKEAILRGDTSNAVVNRHFLHAFQAVGTHLCGVPDEAPAMVRLQARYAQTGWESMIGVYRIGDRKLLAQAILLLTHVLVIMGFTLGAQLYLSKVCEVINKAKLQFLPVYGRPPELSDQVREDAAVLSQAIYLENYFYLTLGGPAPVMTARIEGEFLRDLQVRIIPLFFRL